MHHVALDRAGPDDRDLDDEIVERARLQARQHVHLRPALDLKHAERLALLQHLIDFVVIDRLDVGEFVAKALVARDQVEAFADAGQHAQRQHVDLHHVQRIDVVLVPFDEGAVVHCGIADRHELVEPVLGQHIAADMLRQMARKFDQFGGEPHRLIDHGVVRIKPGLPHLHLGEAVAPAAPHRVGEQRGDVLGQPERLADVADRAARPVVDDGRDDGGAMAAITAIDILHHLLAPRMLEVDIDIRRLQPLLGNEALEQQIDLGRIDRGDAEHIAHGRIRRRSPALAEDVLRARIAHDVVHGQEIMRVVEFGDEIEFLSQRRAQPIVDPIRETGRGTGPGQILQMSLRGLARRHRLIRILVFKLIERKIDAIGKAQGLPDRLGMIAKQPDHLGRRLEMPLGIGLQQAAGGLDTGLLADATDDVLQHPPLGQVIEHVIGGDQRDADIVRNPLQAGQAPPVVAMMEQAGGEPDALGRQAAQRGQTRAAHHRP